MEDEELFTLTFRKGGRCSREKRRAQIFEPYVEKEQKKTHVPLETFLLDSQSSCKSYLYSEGTERDEKPYNYLLKG